MKSRLLQALSLCSLFFSAGVANAAVTYAENTSVQGNMCVGTDCATEETLLYPVLKVKENNTRIVFYDSSADTAGDSWRMVANDSSNGGKHYFKFQSENTAGVIFTSDDLDAGAPVLGSVVLGLTGSVGDTSSPAYTDGTVLAGTAEIQRRLVHLADAVNDFDLINRAQLAELSYPEQKARLADLDAQLTLAENRVAQIEGLLREVDDFEDKGGAAWWVLFFPLLWMRRFLR